MDLHEKEEEDNQHTKSVCEDLIYIAKFWKSGNLEARDIRSQSNLLRRLLVHSELHKVWVRLIGKEPMIIPCKEITVTDESRLKIVDFFTCTEVTTPTGTTFEVGMVYGLPETKMRPDGKLEIVRMPDNGLRVTDSNLTIHEYLKSIAIVAEGLPINRNQIIQYVANSLGGAHFGMQNSAKSDDFKLAMKKLKKFDVGELPASLHELLGMAQALCNAPSTARLLSQYQVWQAQNPGVRIS